MVLDPRGEVSIAQALGWAAERLDGRVANARVDAEILLRHVLDCSRVELFAHANRRVSTAEALRFEELVDRRREMEPLQYLTGNQPFRRIDLLVGTGVLVPRPETEILVERALARVAGLPRPKVIDMGTGSGAIALSVATEAPESQVWACDVSAEALAWAKKNVERMGVEGVTILEGDLFDPLPEDLRGTVDLVVANPPYASEAEIEAAPVDVRDHEPRVATVSGPTGLELAARVAEEAVEWLRPGGWLVMETWPGQWKGLKVLLESRYVEVGVHPDLAGALRVVEGRRP